MSAPLLVRLDARDRALMARYAIAPSASPFSRLAWTGVTHLGSAGGSVLAAGLPWFACCNLHRGSRLALAALLISHLLVQLVKRTVVRGRPSVACDLAVLVREPDRFSFPSGHATASMAVALSYGAVFPVWAVPMVGLAALVGFSRVRLGVHYPGDVVIGQVLAAATVALLIV